MSDKALLKSIHQGASFDVPDLSVDAISFIRKTGQETRQCIQNPNRFCAKDRQRQPCRGRGPPPETVAYQLQLFPIMASYSFIRRYIQIDLVILQSFLRFAVGTDHIIDILRDIEVEKGVLHIQRSSRHFFTYIRSIMRILNLAERYSQIGSLPTDMQRISICAIEDSRQRTTVTAQLFATPRFHAKLVAEPGGCKMAGATQTGI